VVETDPVATGKSADELPVQTPWMTRVNVFDGGIDFEPRILQTASERFVLTPVPLLIHQQCQSFIEAEPADFGIFHLPAHRLGHAEEFQGIQFFDRRLV
jgi:hypothetical protein